MNKRLTIKVVEHNNLWNKDHWYHKRMRIIKGTLKPNCDKSLKQYINKGLMSQIELYGQKI